jgi:dolichyl-diphosphooligosaccharide--protein glycosyltransferase
MSAARKFIRQDGSSQIGGIGPYPEERVPALEHYRLVKVSESSAYESYQYTQYLRQVMGMTQIPPQFLTQTSPAWVKTFERVPGATVQGSNAPANSTVTAVVEMRIPTTNETFVYRQQTQANAQGEFTLTLPYSTTGYDQFGPQNGYTDVSVKATGPYTISATPSVNESGYVTQYGAKVNISEALVVGADDGPKTVTLTKKVQAPEGASGNQTGGGANETATGTNETATGANQSGTNQSALTPTSFAVGSDEGSAARASPSPTPVRLEVAATTRR